MPPKVRPLRKGSTARVTVKDVSIPSSSIPTANPTSSTVSPKPAGAVLPAPFPGTVLGPEMQALEECLKEAAINTGKIFRFYADVRKERLVSHAPYPPKVLVRALGRSLERYDQICDTIETQLLHAIAVFQRDLKAEQARIDAETSAAAATNSKRPSISTTASPRLGAEHQYSTESPTSMLPPAQMPLSSASAVSIGSRRQSAILSSLHRPSFPLKLDLTAAGLAGNADLTAIGQPMDVNIDLGLTSLPSPVTLAPKTARALANDADLPDIFAIGSAPGMSTVTAGEGGDSRAVPGSVGMKTTGGAQEEVIDLTGSEQSRTGTTQLGDSADKPIELDLEGSYEDMGLFGGVESNHNGAIAASSTAPTGGAPESPAQLDVNMEGLFTPQDDHTNAFPLDDDPMGETGPAPDPGAILASLTSSNEAASSNTRELSSLLPNTSEQTVDNSQGGLTGESSADTFAGLQVGGAGTQFDLIDLSSFSGLFDNQEGGEGGGVGEGEVDIMSLLAMDGEKM